jgi:hypothetical protein
LQANDQLLFFKRGHCELVLLDLATQQARCCTVPAGALDGARIRDICDYVHTGN